MPELPEVQTVVDSLRPHLLGRSITRVDLRRKDVLTPASIDLVAKLTGRTITNITRRAKRIVFTLDNADRFYIHLGMSGRLRLADASDELANHTHLIINFGLRNADCGMEFQSEIRNPKSAIPQMRFVDPRRFGGIWWLGDSPDEPSLGPEPLTLSPKQLAIRLAKTKRAIKVALLDQRLIAGLGNIYVDEALHAAGIHPATLANQLTPPQIAKLSRSIKTVLRRAIQSGGSSLRDYVDANGQRGDFLKYHRVYDRKGEPCVTCKTPIRRIVLGGRSTHFCERCQKKH